MAGDVIVTVTLNAALHVCYAAGDLDGRAINPVSRPQLPGRRSRRDGGQGAALLRA